MLASDFYSVANPKRGDLHEVKEWFQTDGRASDSDAIREKIQTKDFHRPLTKTFGCEQDEGWWP